MRGTKSSKWMMFLQRWAPWLFSVCPEGNHHRKHDMRCYCGWPQRLYLHVDGEWLGVVDPTAFATRTVTLVAPTTPPTGEGET